MSQMFQSHLGGEKKEYFNDYYDSISEQLSALFLLKYFICPLNRIVISSHFASHVKV